MRESDGGQPNTASEKIEKGDEKLGPFREASIVRGSVHVEKVRGNLVEQMYFSEDDLRALLALVSSDSDDDSDCGRSIVTDGGRVPLGRCGRCGLIHRAECPQGGRRQ